MRYFSFTDGIIKYNDIRPIYAGTQQCQPLHLFGPVSHHHHVIHFCKSGRGVFSTDSEVHEIGPGQIFIKNPGKIYFQQADELNPWHYTWIAFTGTIGERISKLPEVIALKDTSAFDEMEQLIMDYIMNPEKYIICLIKLFEQLLTPVKTEYSDYAIRAKEYIDVHYMENISVEKIASDFGVDRRYLLRVFKRRYNFTLIEYLIKVRMEAAAGFLKQGHMVGKTALMCGYPDQYSFSKIFKKYYTVSPSHFAACYKLHPPKDE